MTMAVKDKADLRKMEAAAGERCVYIGWAGVRRNALLEKICSGHAWNIKRRRAPKPCWRRNALWGGFIRRVLSATPGLSGLPRSKHSAKLK